MPVTEGSFVRLSYTGKIGDRVFDTTDETVAKEAGIHNPQAVYGPILVRVGNRHVVIGLDDALVGKEAGEEGSIVLLEVVRWRRVPPSRIVSSSLHTVAISPDSHWVAAGSGDAMVEICEIATGCQPRFLQGHKQAVGPVAFSPDGRWLASGGADKTIRLWDVNKWAPVRTLTGHTGTIHGLAFSPDGKWLASAGGDQTIRVWDLQFLPKSNTQRIR